MPESCEDTFGFARADIMGFDADFMSDSRQLASTGTATSTGYDSTTVSTSTSTNSGSSNSKPFESGLNQKYTSAFLLAF
ncbi:hypothetical protein PHISCL_02086 [Aspergillus sclerotialis]|uniref:Uncharacterized protein n=1 Tax=Aspergillus sclerotialis TaxID=2070753 RepID=A0A3A2ZRA7_9EURO|nr:hypothetical protein PHISCL_02086 [Aspergillus sclerotialis]